MWPNPLNYTNSISLSNSPFALILGLQPCEKAAMLEIKTMQILFPKYA